MIIELRAKENLPNCVTNEMVVFVKNFTRSLIEEIGKYIECQIQNSDLDPAYFFPEVNSVMRVFETFQSEYRIRKLYLNHPKFVCLLSIPFNTRVETVFSYGRKTQSLSSTPGIMCQFQKLCKRFY
jgi:hypothetical protein